MAQFTIYNSDALVAIKKIPSDSVDCVFTSPPYWALRSYLPEGHTNKKFELGSKTTFKEYVEKLVSVFDEVKRVLKPSGTCFVNLGDTYYSLSGGKFLNDNLSDNEKNLESGVSQSNSLKSGKELEQKNLCNIPARFSIAMQDHGWILRNRIVWHKPSCMPSSIKDRFTVDFEDLFFFTKSKNYFFEQQLEPYSDAYLNENQPMGVLRQRLYENSKFVKEENAPNQFKGKATKEWMQKYQKNEDSIHGTNAYSDGGRNMRTVWAINPEPYKEAHFACFPTELVRRGLKAGCPEKVCLKCGKPREAIKEPTPEYAKFLGKSWHDHENDSEMGFGQQTRGHAKGNVQGIKKFEIKGFSDCGCGAGFGGGLVLDPFVGSGTTLFVAQELGLNGIGIELNDKYIPLIVKRLRGHENQTALIENIKVIK